MDVSENSGTPKSSILIGFSVINHPFWGSPIFGSTRIDGGIFGASNGNWVLADDPGPLPMTQVDPAFRPYDLEVISELMEGARETQKGGKEVKG